MTAPRPQQADEGSILPLVAGFVALALAVALVLAAASSLYLARKRLLTVADGAALAAAESFDLSAAQVEDGRVRAELDDREVHAAAVQHLGADPTALRDGIALVAATTPDGRSASVTLSSTWRPPFIVLLVPDGVPLEVTVTARTVIG